MATPATPPRVACEVTVSGQGLNVRAVGRRELGRGYRALRVWILVRTGEHLASTAHPPDRDPKDEVCPVTPEGSGVAAGADPSARLGPAALAVESSLDRLVLVVLPPWLAVLTLEGLAAGRVWPSLVVAAAAVVGVVGYGVFLGAGPRRRAVYLLGPLAVSAGVLVLGNEGALVRDASFLVLNWLAMVCFCIGALLRGRAAAGACLLVVGGWLAVALARDVVVGSPVTAGVFVATAVLALVDGLVVASAAVVARKTAAGVDQAAESEVVAAAGAARSEAAERELRQVTRLMHDTAVNTLGAVYRWPQEDRGALSRRCATDLAIMTRAQRLQIVDPQDLVASVVDRAAMLGIDVRVHAERWGPPLDPNVGSALEGAAWEAMNNVAKHSGQHRASLEWEWDGCAGVLSVVDHGHGFSQPDECGEVRACSEGAAAHAGVAVRVNSAQGLGTRVELIWSAAQTSTAVDLVPGPGVGVMQSDPGRASLDSVLAEGSWRIAAVLGGVGVISTVAAPAGQPRWGNIAALMIVGAVGGYCRALSRGLVRKAIPGALYAVGSFLASVLPGMGIGGCTRVSDWWWGPLAWLAVVSAAVLVDRRPTVILVALATGTVGTVIVIEGVGDFESICTQDAWSILVFNVAIVGALVMFRRRLVALWEQGQEIHERVREETVAKARSDEMGRIRREHLEVAHRVAAPLLGALATGQADPLDPDTRNAAGHAESTLRALAAIPPTLPAEQAAALTRVVLAAHERTVTLQLSLPSHLPAGNQPSRDQISPVLFAFVASCPAGSAAQLTYLRVGTTLHILAWTALTGFDTEGLAAAIGENRSMWSLDTTDGQVLLESVQPLDPSCSMDRGTLMAAAT